MLSQSSHPLPASLDAPVPLMASSTPSKLVETRLSRRRTVLAQQLALSMAYTGAEFAGKVICTIKGEKGTVIQTRRVVTPSGRNLART
ncbi:hypothetical protein BDR03DRAFT_969009 [Suillus americanus]|nr:hypothetical protein BDR03DRAFT_969009 [Suillus americanus]